MTLQELPPEIFAKIVKALANVQSIESLVKYRLVSPKFNSFIMDNVLSTAARYHIATTPPDSKVVKALKQVFKHHAGEIMTRKVMRRRTGSSSFLRFLQHLVNAVMFLEGHLDPKREDQLREQYTRNICHAATALSPDVLRGQILQGVPHPSVLPRSTFVAIAAAVGNVQMLLRKLSASKDILCAESGFPNALDAAVAANQKNMVNGMLNNILSKVKGPQESKSGTWSEMRAAAAGVYDALLVAIRLHNHDIANVLFKFMTQNEALAQSVAPESRRLLHEACISYGNVEFYSRALYYKQHRKWLLETTNKADGDSVTAAKDEVKYLLKRCSKWMLRRLIETKQFNVNHVGDDTTPIILALCARRQDLVKVLVETGADIHGLPRGGGKSAMQHAMDLFWEKDIRFLKNLEPL